MDVVGVYETFARQQEAEVTLKYEAIRLRVAMAELLGVLADGSADMSKPFTLTIVNGNSGRLQASETEEAPKAEVTTSFEDRSASREAH